MDRCDATPRFGTRIAPGGVVGRPGGARNSTDGTLARESRCGAKRDRSACWASLRSRETEEIGADFWVFMLLGFNGRTKDFVLIPPEDLLQRLESIHRSPNKSKFQTYLWTTEKQCFETRGLPEQVRLKVAHGQYEDTSRDLSQWLNNWTPVQRLNE